MADPSRRPLRIPPHQLPYLEKHRIFELFHEIARELVIQQPADHVKFIKEILVNASLSKDVARVIILGSAKVNTLNIANEIAKQTNQLVITNEQVLNFLHQKDRSTLSAKHVVMALSHLTKTGLTFKYGWILVDVIQNEREGRELIKAGILPTHVLHLISPFYPKLDELAYCHTITEWPEYRRNAVALRHIFKKQLTEIHMKQKKLNKIVEECINMIKIRKCVLPMTPRIVLYGPRGSGRNTQAKYLAENFGLININFERLLCKYWNCPSELGQKLRACKDEACFHSELLVQVVNERVLQEDCLKKGWVLTRFPFTETDFKHLDCIDTPPNRVIFLECDLNICRERMNKRKYDVVTGAKTFDEDHNRPTQRHPKDDPSILNAELEFFCEQYGNIRRYCGETANIVNGDQPERWVFENICAILKSAPPAAPPRKGCEDITESLKTSSSIRSMCKCTPIPSKILECFMQTI